MGGIEMSEPTQADLRRYFAYDTARGGLYRYEHVFDTATAKIYVRGRKWTRKPEKRIVWFGGYPYLEKRLVWVWHNGPINPGDHICLIDCKKGNLIQNLTLVHGGTK
jgi:hypothetical protein